MRCFVHIGDCDICGAENVRLFWSRAYPELQMCHDCFHGMRDYSEGEDEETAARTIRNSIAKMLRRIRKDEGRKEAIRIHSKFRGTGVPQNFRRKQ